MRATWLVVLMGATLGLACASSDSWSEEPDHGPSVFVAVYETACGVAVVESQCAGAVVDSLLAWGIGVFVAPELPVVTTVPAELRERVFGENAAGSATLSATMNAAGGFSIQTETKTASWSDFELHNWPWRLDEAAVAAMAKEKGATYVISGTARAGAVATDLSDAGLNELKSVRGSLGARLTETASGMLRGSYREEVSQVSTSCALAAGKCFAVLGTGAAEKFLKALTK
jgi:hypothetical protein